MATNTTKGWYVGKRAEAFVYSRFAERQVVVRDQKPQDFGVDFVADRRKGP